MRSDHLSPSNITQLPLPALQHTPNPPLGPFLQLCHFEQYRLQQLSQAGINVGKWNTQEQMLYKRFLEDNLDHFVDKSVRKSQKVFLKMSKIIPTRTAEQCRTHHQKMLKFHGSA